MRLDLHAHTSISDGEYAPQDMAEMARAAGLDGVAITDHDECRGFGMLEPIDGLLLIPGIEMAAHEGDSEVHVLGLDINWRHVAMTGYVERATLGRQQRAQAMTHKLRAAGYDVDIADVARIAGSGVIGRPHIARALVEKGYAETVGDAFERFISRDAPFYIPLEKISVARAAEVIRKAGGKPVLAHPGLLKPGLFDTLEGRLADAGFWGIEAYHPIHTDGQCRIFESAARRQGLFVTAGSDFHGTSGLGASLGSERRGGNYLQTSFESLVESLSFSRSSGRARR